MLEVFYGCGLRTGEVRRLALDDINLRTGTLHIQNRKVLRIVLFLSARSQSRGLNDTLPFVAPYANLKEVFLMDNNHTPLKECYVSTIIKRYVRKTGITKKIVPHSFRHTFATHLLEEGAPLPHIQALLGHSSLDSTQIYTRVAMTDIKKIHSMTHPRENFNVAEEQRDMDTIQFSRRYEPRKKRRNKK